jgi:hypothetical protein
LARIAVMWTFNILQLALWFGCSHRG